ncbi:MAG: DUF805 domain-containing protein [Pseudomonadota bacterium]
MSNPEPTLFWLFFQFKGRIARKSFILAALFLLLPQLVAILQIVRYSESDQQGELIFWTMCFFLIVAASIWSIIALFVKRLHDLSLPGALALIAVFSGINLLFFLYLAFAPSKQEVNEYGPPPFPIDVNDQPT